MMLMLAGMGYDVRTDVYTVAQAKEEIERLMKA